MDVVLNIIESIKSDPLYPILITLLIVGWRIFVHFSNQRHKGFIAEKQSNLKVEEAREIELQQNISKLERYAGEVKELALSYKTLEEKKKDRATFHPELTKISGQFSTYPDLQQAIRDFCNRCSIMAESDPHPECREEVQQFFNCIINECKKEKDTNNA